MNLQPWPDLFYLKHAKRRSKRHCALSLRVAGVLSTALQISCPEGKPALHAGRAQADAGHASSWIKTTLMLEEYLDGPEVDVDVIFSEGDAVYGAITDNWPTVEPYFNETGSNCPSILPASQQRELMDLAVASVHALGFQMARPHAALLLQLLLCIVAWDTLLPVVAVCNEQRRPLFPSDSCTC